MTADEIDGLDAARGSEGPHSDGPFAGPEDPVVPGEGRVGDDERLAREIIDQVWPSSPRPVGVASWSFPERIGRFRVLKKVGQGGFGIVYEAEEPTLGRVAVKVPRLAILDCARDRQRFVREGEAAQRLRHPNIVRVLEVGEADSIEYIASEYVDGPNLRGWMAEHHGPVDRRFAARLTAILARALAHAHENGVLHRDLKPDNVLLRSARDVAGDADALPFEPLLCDFGLAWVLDMEEGFSSGQMPAGAPPYMAPETARGDGAAIGPATDVYGLGAILYEMLTGRPPFEEDRKLVPTLFAVTEVAPVSPRRLDRGIPRGLEVICLRCLEKRPEDRYPTALDLAGDLERFLNGLPIKGRRAFHWNRARRAVRRHAVAASLGGMAVMGVLLLPRLPAGLVSDPERMAAAPAVVEPKSSILAQKSEEDARAPRPISLIPLLGPSGAPLIAGHSPKEARTIAFRPDGRVLASGGDDGVVRLWEVSSGKPLGVLEGHGARVSAVVWSPDGKTVASGGSDCKVRLWDEETLKERACFHEPADAVKAMDYTTNGPALAAAHGVVVTFWDPSTGKHVALPNESDKPITSMAISPDGRTCISADLRGLIWIRDLQTGKRREIPTRSEILSLAVRNGTREFAVGDTAGRIVIKTTDPQSSTWQRNLDSSGKDVSTLAFTPDGAILASGRLDGTVSLWDPDTGKELLRLDKSRQPVNAVAFSPDGKLLAAADHSGAVRLWRVQRP